MTKKDIIVQVLVEVSEKPVDFVKGLLERFDEEHPGAKWNDELPDEEAQRMLSDLRREKSGIMAWLVRGAIDVAKNTGHA